MRRRRFLKHSQVVERTTNRREYKILSTVEQDLWECDYYCSMSDHCSKHKHVKCRPHRARERNWKSQRKYQFK